MSTGLYRIEWVWIAGVSNRLPSLLATIGRAKRKVIWSAVALAAIGGAWILLSGEFGRGAEREPVMLGVVTEPDPGATSAAVSAQEAVTPPGDLSNLSEASPEAAAPADRLKISSQHWRRGGLGSKALVTFTLRNGNDYAVKDIEISCAFSRGDGSHVTDRTRVIHDTIKTKGRKTFARIHVGFVNINANRAKCVPVAASRV